jgi:hypothetical protein
MNKRGGFGMPMAKRVALRAGDWCRARRCWVSTPPTTPGFGAPACWSSGGTPTRTPGWVAFTRSVSRRRVDDSRGVATHNCMVMRAMGRRRRDALLARDTLGQCGTPLRPGEPVRGYPTGRSCPRPATPPLTSRCSGPRTGSSSPAMRWSTCASTASVVLLHQQPGLSGPPWCTTWSHAAAASTIQKLAALHPMVLGPGHGPALTGPDTPQLVQGFARRR